MFPPTDQFFNTRAPITHTNVRTTKIKEGSLIGDSARNATPRAAKRKTFNAHRGGQRVRSDSSAAQRGNDDHFVAGLQAMVQAGDAVPVHEETDVRADSILFVRDRRLCLKFTAFNIRD